MIRKKEKIIIDILRKDARMSLAKISEKTHIPVSTLFDVLKKMEKHGIMRYVSLIDFSEAGYNLKVVYVIKARNKQELKNFLMKNRHVNTVASVMNDADFFAECVFKDLKEMTLFKTDIEQFEITGLNETFIVDDIKKESFMTSQENEMKPKV